MVRDIKRQSMSFWSRFHRPDRSSYETEEEYEEALESYENAEYWALEAAEEDR